MSDIKTEIRIYIESNLEIKLSIGLVTNLTLIGEGGNGLVYKGKINTLDIALKIFTGTISSKRERFKAEYINIMCLNPKPSFLVQYINYEEFQYNLSTDLVPIIVMKLYPKTLKTYRTELLPDISETISNKLYKFFIEALAFIHERGIFHRDIKPENILVDGDDNFVLSDFGIAKYDSDFPVQPKTGKTDRMANWEFSPPELLKASGGVSAASDIYSMGEVIQWFVTGSPHRGTGRENIRFPTLDKIVDKCLVNDPFGRFQSVKEICRFKESFNTAKNEWDQACLTIDKLVVFNLSLRKSYTPGYEKVGYISDNNIAKRLLANLKNEAYELWFNTGKRHSPLLTLDYDYEDGIVILNYKEAILKGIWVYFSNCHYDDLVILDLQELPPYKLDNGDSSMRESYVNNAYWVSTNEADCGYIEVKGEQDPIEVKVREDRERSLNDRYWILGIIGHCSQNKSNDSYIEDIQGLELDETAILSLLKKIRENKHRYVLETL